MLQKRKVADRGQNFNLALRAMGCRGKCQKIMEASYYYFKKRCEHQPFFCLSFLGGNWQNKAKTNVSGRVQPATPYTVVINLMLDWVKQHWEPQQNQTGKNSSKTPLNAVHGKPWH